MNGHSRFTAALILAASVVLISPSVAVADSVGTATGPQASYADAVPGLAPAEASATAVYLDERGRQISSPGGRPQAFDSDAQSSGVQAAAFGCTPESRPDNPHYTAPDVSGHGAWRIGNCAGATHADVFNCLYEYFTDNTWRRIQCSVLRTLRPYTGSGDRTNARKRCVSTVPSISWRNHVDVDVHGQVDTADVPYRQAVVRCRI